MMMMPSIFGGNLFNDDWMDFSFPDIDKELYGKHAKNLMKTDVKEKDGNYEVAIDLPGFKKDEITAELKDGYLTISAAKGLDKDEKDKEGKYIRRERYAGNMSRSFYVGKDITEKDIHGKYENGILMLDIPKKAPEKKVDALGIQMAGRAGQGGDHVQGLPCRVAACGKDLLPQMPGHAADILHQAYRVGKGVGVDAL